VLVELVAGVDAVGRRQQAASTPRILNTGGPPYCSDACRMSGVFTKKFGRM
jgi:hypothetical protein